MAGETERAARIESLLSEAAGNIDEKLKERQAKDRSLIGNAVIFAFIGAIALLFVFIIVSGVITSACTGASCPPYEWEKPAEYLTTILSSVLLPVVTLVIGYYFGTEKDKGNG